MKATIIAVLVMIIFGSVLLKEETASVTTPEIKKTSNEYKRPVREGNCWRQFIGTGDTDSILVCG
jgi:uncharacterized protein YxeA